MTLVREEVKRITVDNFFEDIMGSQLLREARLDFEYLSIPRKNLTDIDVGFS